MISLDKKELPSRISFRRYWMGRHCPGAALPESCLRAEVPRKPAKDRRLLVLGSFFHELIREVFEDIPRESELSDRLRQVFTKLIKKYQTNETTVNFRFDPLVSQIYESVRHHLYQLTEYAGVLHFEREVQSADGQLFGIPDLVCVTKGEIVLIDFKLTSRRENLAKEKNAHQLLFYSNLVEEQLGNAPSVVRLVGLRGATVDIAIEDAQKHELARSARELLSVYKSASKGEESLEDIANPSALACKSCLYRSICTVSVWAE